jgi:hypothetical protein
MKEELKHISVCVVMLGFRNELDLNFLTTTVDYTLCIYLCMSVARIHTHVFTVIHQFLQQNKICEISNSPGGEYEYDCLLGCCAV